MSCSGQVWACDFGLGPSSGFKMGPAYNSGVNAALYYHNCLEYDSSVIAECRLREP